MAKIWQKNYELNTLLEEFTVGNDYLLDLQLITADCFGSAAHGAMLQTIGILTEEEEAALRRELASIASDAAAGRFVIARDQEDCHSAIEARLTEVCGDAGKKIHTGRSRNDQVITALRLWMKEFLLEFLDDLTRLIARLGDLAETHRWTPMPGRTHMQIAMPSSVGLWAGAFAEELADQGKMLLAVLDTLDQNPLGSAASYGVPLALDRKLTGELMGFSRVQNNVLYVNNSRGKMESLVLDGCDQVVLTLSKIAQDLILFSLPEFGYFSLPDELCSGSSIMPQKKNPDGLELMRARSASLSGYAAMVKNIVRSLPSGYNRDFQDTKEPLLRGAQIARQCVRIIDLTIEKLIVHEDTLASSFAPEIYATDAALEAVAAGASFRDAYVQVGLNIAELGDRDPITTLKDRTGTGMAGNLGLEKISETVESLTVGTEALKKTFAAAQINLFGKVVL